MSERKGVSRRDFLRGVGIGAVAASSLGGLERAAEAEARDQEAGDGGPLAGPGAVPIRLRINGEEHRLSVEPRVTLLDALRNHLDLTGSKKVCDRATCGACTVLIDGKPAYGCTVLAIAAQGREIETVESLASGDELAAIQAAFVKNDAQQCGFCTPGFVVACEGYLRAHEPKDVADVCAGLGGNLCRCGTYAGIKQAVLDAAARKRGGR